MRAVGMRLLAINVWGISSRHLGLVTDHTHVVRVHQSFVPEEDRACKGPITFHSLASPVPPCTPRPDPQTGFGGV
ncbi:hypothetical protein EDB85DRAFT_2036966 [Lactarius pseudohatsudake]|nr:hypothetical protein EDB85DRAFT_2036966 [Lactarius pseudohatsudake]